MSSIAPSDRPRRWIDIHDKLRAGGTWRALIMGWSHSEIQYDHMPRLEGTSNDARSLYSKLTKPPFGLFDHKQSKKLIGKKLIVSSVNNAIRILHQQSNVNDLILCYFAGHGRKFDGKIYLSTYDYVDLYPDKSSIELVWLINELARIPAGAVVVVLDHCIPNLPDGVPPHVVVIAAAEKDERSYESKQLGENQKMSGVLTSSILSTLSQHSPCGRVICLGHIIEDAQKSIALWSSKTTYRQRPQVPCDTNLFDLPIAIAPQSGNLEYAMISTDQPC